MDILSCPVCHTPLHKTCGRLTCDEGHSFDLSREGYVNLLIGSKGSHGDNRLMLEGRRRFLESGYYECLKDAIVRTLLYHAEKDCVLVDVGCGEGYYTEALSRALSQRNGTVYGLDVSKDAVRYAARRRCGAQLFVGSAYGMPLRDECADIVTLFFSPFAREELLRVLKKNGIFMMAIPGEEHLFGLKSAVYKTPYKNHVLDTQIEGFTLLCEEKIEGEITFSDQESIQALFAMTPYYYKTSKEDKEKLKHLLTLTTRIEFLLLTYQKR